MLISLDIDGVLADFYPAVRAAQTAGIPRRESVMWWGELKPFPPPKNKAVAVGLLKHVQIHLVTRRRENCAGVTDSWLRRYYPEIMERAVGLTCTPVNPKVPELRGSTYWPDVAIDDTHDEIIDYVKAEIPVICVESAMSNPDECMMLGVPVVPDVWSALAMAVVSPSSRLAR